MEYTISSDKSKINLNAVHEYLCHKSYWAKGRSIERVQESINNSECFGMYDSQGRMLGFARLLSDKVVFAYLMDVIIFEEFQGKGLGKALVKHMIDCPDFSAVRLWFLATDSAHGLYEKFGFSSLDNPNRYMLKRNSDFL